MFCLELSFHTTRLELKVQDTCKLSAVLFWGSGLAKPYTLNPFRVSELWPQGLPQILELEVHVWGASFGVNLYIERRRIGWKEHAR